MKLNQIALVAAIALCSATASATGRGVTVPADVFACDPPTYDHVLFHIQPPLPPCAPTTGVVFTVKDDSIAFEHGATVDFADFTMATPGPQRGYVYIRVQGTSYLVPFYNLK